MKKLIFSLMLMLLLMINSISIAEDVDFEIIPENTNQSIGNIVENVSEGGEVWDRYKDTAYGKETTNAAGVRTRVGSDLSLGDQFASGIMTWDTILDYAVYLVKFLGQIALLIGGLMIIYYGYKKATEHFKFNGTLGKVVFGILVISFAYVIVKMIWSMFVS
ncbi:MAG TPA: hypothetical protein P5060_02070 [Candidatus Absconditabacterales bacterium]|nr:hypothetical protein [Candidatus Absconditabacterales bacterium]